MININNISFSYPDKEIFSDFSLHIKKGDRICLFGKSGCGKTTLLRLILSLEKPQGGSIVFDGNLKPAVVFQENRLLPFKTVAENITLFGADRSVAQDNLNALGIGETADLLPQKLSGGMQRRAAIARALSTDFDFLVLDEPFSGLDSENTALSAKRILKVLGDRPLIAVSHSEYEAELLDAKIIKL